MHLFAVDSPSVVSDSGLSANKVRWRLHECADSGDGLHASTEPDSRCGIKLHEI
jgi:hypothetical protein